MLDEVHDRHRDEIGVRTAKRGGKSAGPPAGGPRSEAAGTSPALALLSDVTGVPLEETLADFWSPGLSQARLRALPASPATPPDLLIRISDAPELQVRGTDLRDLLIPAYARLAEAEADPASET